MDIYGYDVSSRILNRSVKRDNGCIEYRGDKKLKHKYGLISITINGKRKSVPAHRAMYMAINNCFDLPRHKVIRHKCDNPRCINDKHLIEVTFKDNMQDCIERKRRATKYRLHTRHRILSDDIIRAIRNEPAYFRTSTIASKYGISIGYVSKIRGMRAKTLL